MKSLYTPQVELVGKVMDMQMQRQNVLMSNVANVNTPRYQRRTLDFEEALQSALGLDKRGKMTRTDENHMPVVFNPDGFSAEWTKGIKPRVAHGEDRVNLDKEMTRMAKNTLHYNALSQVIKTQFDSVRTSIQEGQK